MNKRFFPLALAAVWVVQGAAGRAPAPRVVDLTAPDRTMLKTTYLAASKPGPGVMLFHQCNRDRKMWEELAPRLVAAGAECFDARLPWLWGQWRNAKVRGPARGGPAAGYRGLAATGRTPCGSRGATSGAGVLQLRVAQARRYVFMSLMISYRSYFNTGLFQNAQIGFGGAAVGDHFLQG
jgi:hypothetical protein